MTDIKLVESMIRNIIREEIQAAYAAIRNEMEQRIYEGKPAVEFTRSNI